MPLHDDQLEYYRRELTYFRTESANFAARHPKVAQRLVLSDSHSADPHDTKNRGQVCQHVNSELKLRIMVSGQRRQKSHDKVPR